MGRANLSIHATISLLVAGLVLGAACAPTTGSDTGEQEASVETGSVAERVVIATVLGRKVVAEEADALRGIVLVTLLDDFATRNGIEPTEAEIDAFLRGSEARERAGRAEMKKERARLVAELQAMTLSESERAEREEQLETIDSVREMNREMDGEVERGAASYDDMVRELVRGWKINQALFARYGGRVVFQQAGVEPLDAYRAFLEEHAKQKSFQIFDARAAADFWAYFTNDDLHVFYDPGEGRRLIETPWWLSPAD